MNEARRGLFRRMVLDARYGQKAGYSRSGAGSERSPPNWPQRPVCTGIDISAGMIEQARKLVGDVAGSNRPILFDYEAPANRTRSSPTECCLIIAISRASSSGSPI